MGANNYGQLGVGDKAYSAVAVRVNTLDPLRIAAVRAGQHSGALTEEGHLYLWGSGPFGELRLPTKFAPEDPRGARITDFQIGGTCACLIDEEGEVYSWGNN